MREYVVELAEQCVVRRHSSFATPSPLSVIPHTTSRAHSTVCCRVARRAPLLGRLVKYVRQKDAAAPDTSIRSASDRDCDDGGRARDTKRRSGDGSGATSSGGGVGGGGVEMTAQGGDGGSGDETKMTPNPGCVCACVYTCACSGLVQQPMICHRPMRSRIGTRARVAAVPVTPVGELIWHAARLPRIRFVAADNADPELGHPATNGAEGQRRAAAARATRPRPVGADDGAGGPAGSGGAVGGDTGAGSGLGGRPANPLSPSGNPSFGSAVLKMRVVKRVSMRHRSPKSPRQGSGSGGGGGVDGGSRGDASASPGSSRRLNVTALRVTSPRSTAVGDATASPDTAPSAAPATPR